MLNKSQTLNRFALTILACVLILFTVPTSAQEIIKDKVDFPVLTGPYLGQKPPGNVPEVFLPEIVSSAEYIEFGCSFSTDGNEFYFSRTLKDYGVIYVVKHIKGKWTAPEILDISDAKYYSEPHINYAGDQLFFTEFNPDANQSQIPKVTISATNRAEDTWSVSKTLWDGMFATTAKNGNIYYTNNEEQKIYKRMLNQEYSEAEPLVIENCSFPTSHPYIAPDESYIIFGGFNTQGQSKGKWADLYVSFKADNKSFGEPINLGDKINNQYPNICPMVSPDGKYLFYSNKGDIYWVSTEIIEELKAK